jgi:hypothetical protein
MENVRREFASARLALATLIKVWHDDRGIASRDEEFVLTLDDFRRCQRHLEATYFVRQFATFEAILRDFWEKGLRRGTDPDLRPLLNSIAACRKIDPATLASIHQVRDFRNQVMHRNTMTAGFDIAECGRVLSTYISWLPISWSD